MVFEDKKILLFHPGKCAGTSIEMALVKEYLNTQHHKLGPVKTIRKDILYGWVPEDRLFLQHCDIQYLLSHTDIDPTKYTSYCFVRNPYHRLLSAYYYNMIEKNTGMDFTTFIKDPNGLLHRYNLNNEYTVNHFGPLNKFTHHKDYTVDNIGKVENIEQDFKKFFPNLTLPKNKAAKTKTSEIYNDYMDAYTEETKEIVYNLFKDDFILYGYSK